MKSKKILNVIALGLISAVGVGLITPTTPAFAANQPSEIAIANKTNDSEVGNRRTNVKFIKDNSDNSGDLEYTYDQNGKSYKVVEKFTEDFSSGTSNIYEKNSGNNYDLISVINTTSNEKNISLKTLDVKTNNTKTEVVDISNDTTDKNSKLRNNLQSSSSDLTDWQAGGIFYYNFKVVNWTVGAISALIFKNLSKLGGPLAGSTGTLLAYISGIIIAENIPKVYEKVREYYKFINGTSLPRAESSYTIVYTDSSCTKQIGDGIPFEYYVDGYGN